MLSSNPESLEEEIEEDKFEGAETDLPGYFEVASSGAKPSNAHGQPL